MAIGERIKYIRNLKNFTQKYLGQLIGFPEKTADIRIAQYESGTRTPKADITKELAKALEVSPLALDVPDIDSELGLMHTLFALEDIYGLQAEEKDGETKLSFSNASVLRRRNQAEFFKRFCSSDGKGVGRAKRQIESRRDNQGRV